MKEDGMEEAIKTVVGTGVCTCADGVIGVCVGS